MSLQNLFPEAPAFHDIHPPMIYVLEKVEWQYKCISIDLRQDPVPDEKLLDEIGAEGWELVSMLCVQYYLYVCFKRLTNN